MATSDAVRLCCAAGGNSGGPAFNHRGECVGIAFQSLKDGDTENIGEHLISLSLEQAICNMRSDPTRMNAASGRPGTDYFGIRSST